MITFQCKSCAKSVRAPEAMARRPAKCPHCGAINRVPPAELVTSDFRTAAAHDDSTYELTELPPSPWTQPSAARPVPRSPDDADHAKPGAGKQAGEPAAATADAPARREARLHLAEFVTGPRIALLAALVLALVAWVWYSTTLGREATLATAQPVRVTPLVDHAGTSEPWSLLHASGDMSLGVKAPAGMTTEHPRLTEVDYVYKLGGSDGLVHVQPDAGGDQLLVEVAINLDTFRKHDRVFDYKAAVKAGDFELVGADGQTYPAVAVLGDRFKRAMSFDLSISGGGYRSLLPAGVEPSDATFERVGNLKPHAGTLTFDGSQGVAGSIQFTDHVAAARGASGARGLTAFGRLTVDSPDGPILMDYNGSELLVTFPREGGGFWRSDIQRHATGSGYVPWARFRGSLVFDAPATQPYELRFAGEPLMKVKPKAHAELRSRGELIAHADPSQPGKQALASAGGGGSSTGRSGGGSGGGGGGNIVGNAIGGYFDVLSDARENARGLVALSDLRQLGIALMLYREQHQGSAPESMSDLGVYLGMDPSTFRNPRTGDRPGFIYVPPPENADPDATVVIYESKHGKPDQAGSKLYLSGRIEPGADTPDPP